MEANRRFGDRLLIRHMRCRSPCDSTGEAGQHLIFRDKPPYFFLRYHGPNLTCTLYFAKLFLRPILPHEGQERPGELGVQPLRLGIPRPELRPQLGDLFFQLSQV